MYKSFLSDLVFMPTVLLSTDINNFQNDSLKEQTRFSFGYLPFQPPITANLTTFNNKDKTSSDAVNF